jgi:hypothetical protein
MIKFTKEQRDANYLLEQMLSCLENPNVSAFRRIVSRVAIAYIGMIYKLQGYTYAALKELAQECLNMLKNIEIRCNPNFYQRVFAKHQEMATDLRNHYEKKMCIFNLRDWSARNPGVFGDPKWMEEESEDGLEETNELLMRQTI